jgi:hypothetical protein
MLWSGHFDCGGRELPKFENLSLNLYRGSLSKFGENQE